MSVATLQPVYDAAPHRWTVDQFMALLESGVFEEGWRVEMLDGVIMSEMPPGPEHDFAYEALHLFLASKGLYASGLIPMLKFVIPGRSVLEPDFARYRLESIGRLGNKQATDLLWAIEISVTSLLKDLGSKKAAYAAVGVPEYWVIDVENRILRMFSKPVEGVYTEEHLAPEGEIVALPGLDATLDTAGLFPPLGGEREAYSRR